MINTAANSAVPNYTHFEHIVAHPAWHEWLRFPKCFQIAIIETRSDAVNKIIIDVDYSDVDGHLQRGIRMGRGIVEDGRA